MSKGRMSKRRRTDQMNMVGHIGQQCAACGKAFNTLDDLKYADTTGPDGVVCRKCRGLTVQAVKPGAVVVTDLVW